MTKKSFYFTCVMICLITFITGCKEKDDLANPTIGIENPEEVFLSAGNALSKEVNVTSNYDWTPSIPETAPWCSVEKKGKDKLKITVTPNPTTEPRETKVTITSGYDGNIKTAFITIKQEAGAATILTLNAEELIFLAKGESKQLILITNQELWDAQIADKTVNWISFEKNDEGLLITTKENSDGLERNAELIIKVGVEGNKEEAVLKISQFGTNPIIRLSNKELTPEVDGGKFEVEVTTNQLSWRLHERIDYENIGDTWCKLSTEGNKLIVEIEENVKTQPRKAKVYVLAGEGPDEVADTLYIEQVADSEATLSVTNHVIYPKKSATHNLKIETNRKHWKYEVVKGADEKWISLTQTENSIEVKLQENKKEDRSIELNITAGVANNTIRKSLTITQQGGKTSVYVNPTSINLNDNGDATTVKVTSNADWEIFIPEDAKSWCTVEKKSSDEITVKATKVESGSRSVTIKVFAGTGDNYAESELKVTQNKIYKVGDYYTVNGVILGIVFKVTDGGKHGKVFSIDDMKKYPSWLLLTKEEIAAGIEQPPLYGATSRTDGYSNMQLLKQKEPNTWQTRFPIIAWIEQKNKEQGNPGWYWPAIEECAEIAIMFAGEKNENEITPESKKHRDKINKLLIDAGGDIIDYTGEEIGWMAAYLTSSTEEIYQKFPNCWQMCMGKYWELPTGRGDLYYAGPDVDDYSEFGGAVRAVLKF